MGERFEVGQTVRVNIGFHAQDITIGDTAEVLEDTCGPTGIRCRILRNGRVYPFARTFLEAFPADPPSVGVPGPPPPAPHHECCGSSACMTCRVTGMAQSRNVGAEMAYLDRRQMAAQQQQGQRYGLVTIDEHDALKANLEEAAKLAVYWKKQFDDVSKQVADGERHGDLKGERDKLRREKADLETQVAYLTRELVLAKGRAKGGR